MQSSFISLHLLKINTPSTSTEEIIIQEIYCILLISLLVLTLLFSFISYAVLLSSSIIFKKRKLCTHRLNKFYESYNELIDSHFMYQYSSMQLFHCCHQAATIFNCHLKKNHTRKYYLCLENNITKPTIPNYPYNPLLPLIPLKKKRKIK